MNAMKARSRSHVQPRESGEERSARATAEIKTFLRAVESYPNRVAEDPDLTFRQHLANLFGDDRDRNPETTDLNN